MSTETDLDVVVDGPQPIEGAHALMAQGRERRESPNWS